MPTMRMTDAAVRKLKVPQSGRVEVWDDHTRGLGLRISSSGLRSWVLMTRVLEAGAWKQQRVTLGQYPGMSLADARKRADEAKLAARAGEDPAAATREARAVLVEDSRNTYAAVRTEFLQKHRGRQNRRPAPSTLAEITRLLGSADFQCWEKRPLARIGKREVVDVLDGIMARGAEVLANRTLAYLKLLFKWALARGIVQADPTAGIKKPGAERSRERFLTSEEIRLLWLATGADGQFNAIVRLLLLTGQRLNEVAAMRWSEVDTEARTWTLRAARTKNKRSHVVPLTEPVLGILEARKASQEVFATKERPVPPFTFTTTGTSPFSGFSHSKARLDGRINRLLAEANPEADPPPEIEAWRLHDLRRTVATHMAEDLRIAPHIIEAVLNHVSGTKAGVAGVYNRALHLDERTAALDAWAHHVLQLAGEIETKVANVVEP